MYLYANQKGCDGGRLYFDGCAMVWVNGELVAQGSQFEGLDEVETVVATVDLDAVRAFRANFIARSFQASSAPRAPRVRVAARLCAPRPLSLAPSAPRPPRLHAPEEEIAYGPSGWLWDYLRRSGQRGYFLPLSGGADSSSTAALVAIMCQRVVAELRDEASTPRARARLLADVRRITRRPDYEPSDWRELCGKLFVTCYMASEYSGAATRARAEELARAIGAVHTSIKIDAMTSAVRATFEDISLHTDQFERASMRTKPAMEGGTVTENLALQNIQARARARARAARGATRLPSANSPETRLRFQARSRMVMSYFLAQLMPWATEGDATRAGGSLLVLGSANVDEALRGYYTKYDCSAADINPIGGINKRDLKGFLAWCAEHKEHMGVLRDVADAPPSAELTGAEGAQLDEDDMGMSYEELGDLGRCRKVEGAAAAAAAAARSVRRGDRAKL